MKAIMVPRRGGPEVLELCDMPEPQPRAGRNEVLVDVEAVGVNFADTVQTQGMYPDGPRPPYIPGLEFAGRVHESGERVMGFTHSGAYAERLCADRATLLPAPKEWSAAETAAFLVNYFTAYFAYEMAGLIVPPKAGAPRPSVLIHAVAGGVGTASVEVGKQLGVEMFGTSSSPEKLERVRTMGLDHGINYRTHDYEEEVMRLTDGKGVDAAFEMLGGEHTASTTRCLAEMGHLIVYGMATGHAPQFDFMTMFARNLSVHALWLAPLAANAEKMRAAWMCLSPWITAGTVRPVVGHTFPLAQAAEAHRLLLERKNFGKVVLTI
ncbi:MAG: NADPH:quinone oxidoreductase family protein [Acidobacteriales bacterium]|nr:NADPH:quinone oxidoreductase family protein [Terriglobales bacterium]